MPVPHPRLLPILVALVATGASAQVTGFRGLRDHSQCCAIGMPNLHGTDGTFDPAPDPVFSRPRAPAPPAPVNAATSAATATTEESSPKYPPLEIPKRKIEGHLDVGFETLGGFPFSLTNAQAAVTDAPAIAALNARIPEIIRDLDGKKIAITGYMMPVKMDGAVATEFLLVANSLLCCYGIVPPMNQWMSVKLARGGVPPQQDVPLQVFGTLRVGPQVDNGAISAIYHLDAVRVGPPARAGR